jgi:hypothetical protein
MEKENKSGAVWNFGNPLCSLTDTLSKISIAF